MKKIGLVFLFLFILSANALATDYYVKTGGSNASDGLTWGTAKATISAAMLLVNGSDNVHVAAGTYNERVTFHASNSNQLLGGYPAAGGGTRAPWTNQTIISGSSLTGSVVSIPQDGSTNRGFNGIVIDGFTIRNGTKSGFACAGIESYTVGLTIKDCIVENNTSTGSGWVGGIYVIGLLNEYSSRLLKIESCIIRNNTGPGTGGILIDAIAPFQFQLINSLIYGNNSSATGSPWQYGVGGVAIGTGSQYMATPPNNPKIINCTIANNTAAHTTKKVGGLGVNLEYGETVTIANSIIWQPGTGVDDIYAYNGETIALSYSDVEDAGDTGTGVIHSNPSFVSGSDYRLNAGSPCIDTGSNSVSGIPSTDLLGNPRIADGDSNGTATVDMGAYEKTGPADTTPPTGSVVINSGNSFTSTTSVTLTLSATDPSGVTHMCISNTNSCSSWETNAASKPWTLAGGDGTKTVYVWFRDGLGNENSTPFSDTIILDTISPVGSIVINGGAGSTNTTSVTLTLSFTDASTVDMRFSDDGSSWSGWEAFAVTKAWDLTSGNGMKTVYVEYRDMAGNLSGSLTDTILLTSRLVDFDGDGATDVAIYEASTGTWYINRSSGVGDYIVGWGGPGYTPVPGDYDGDGETDIAVYEVTTGAWYIKPSSGAADYAVGWGGTGYTPVPGDYDGDGITDIAVYEASTGAWYINPSSGVADYAVGWGGTGYTPVPGDYDGDGKTDIAVYEASTSAWYINPSSGAADYVVGWGGTGYTPVPGDYDGDGITDIAVYQASTGVWYIDPSSGAADYIVGFGGPGWLPVTR